MTDTNLIDVTKELRNLLAKRVSYYWDNPSENTSPFDTDIDTYKAMLSNGQLFEPKF
jgi:hypothetical protein